MNALGGPIKLATALKTLLRTLVHGGEAWYFIFPLKQGEQEL